VARTKKQESKRIILEKQVRTWTKQSWKWSLTRLAPILGSLLEAWKMTWNTILN